MPRVAFAWWGLPEYAARCLNAFVQVWPEPVAVLATRAVVPLENVERSLGQKVHWLESGADRSVRWARAGCPPPDVFFQGGYHLPAFNALGAECRAAGGRVVLLSDNTWLGTLRQKVLGRARHRLSLRRRFSGAFVPGAAARRFAAEMGYPPDRTRTGLYGADPRLFHPGGAALRDRPKEFLFVGQLIERKNVLGLADAFLRVAADHPDWRLRICGSGAQRHLVPSHPRILLEEFVQPAALAGLMREARCLVLPSRREHWGLVVHEAALSGCALALSRTVGAAEDLATPRNAVLFPADDTGAIERALREIAGWNAQRWQAAEAASLRLAAAFGPETFAASAQALVEDVLGHR